MSVLNYESNLLLPKASTQTLILLPSIKDDSSADPLMQALEMRNRERSTSPHQDLLNFERARNSADSQAV